MIDISKELQTIINKEKCTPFYALLIYQEKENKENVCIFQPKSTRASGR